MSRNPVALPASLLCQKCHLIRSLQQFGQNHSTLKKNNEVPRASDVRGFYVSEKLANCPFIKVL